MTRMSFSIDWMPANLIVSPAYTGEVTDEVDVGHLGPLQLILRYTTSGKIPIFSDIEINP